MSEIIIFFFKALIVVLSIGGIALFIAIAASKSQNKSELEINPVHKKFQDLSIFIKSFILTEDQIKEEKKLRKEEEKKEKSQKAEKNVYVIKFDGDINASQTDSLREEITAILQTATPKDEVVVKLESPGGVVHVS